jgi:uncharacterized membrane protein
MKIAIILSGLLLVAAITGYAIYGAKPTRYVLPDSPPINTNPFSF